MSSIFTISDANAFRSFAACGGLLVLKTLAMAPLTRRERFRSKAFPTPEDAEKLGGRVDNEDEAVERVRRAHQNDVENIPVFFANALIFLAAEPPSWMAVAAFRTFTVSRYLHTFFHLNKVRWGAISLDFYVKSE